MTGLEELIRKGYVKATNQGTYKLLPEPFGRFGRLSLGSTTFNVLKQFLDIDFAGAKDFEPTHYEKPVSIAQAKPDELIVSGRSVVSVVEHKSPRTLAGGTGRRRALEQLQVYLLVTKAEIGAVTDSITTLWLHNRDPQRRNQVKIIVEDDRYCQRITADAGEIDAILSELHPQTDEFAHAPAFDPSVVAKSVWQDVYIATRQDPEKCFQTFVELFMYKLVSDYGLLPDNLRIEQLVVSPEMFKRDTGLTQVEFYFQNVRDLMKRQRFPESTTQILQSGLTSCAGYKTTKAIIPSIRSEGGTTSIINGHAFNEQPQDYNTAFVGILKKLAALPNITRLERTFKSRVYEQFLRRDPNTTKVSGKYLTPRNVVKAIVRMARIDELHRDAIICDPACGVGGFITESILELDRRRISNYREDRGKIEVDRKFVGLEVQRDIVCLAKANMLIHCIEMYNDLSEQAKMIFSKELLADVFVHAHEDRILGSLRHPVSDAVDLIMANPPYVVSGTGAITGKIKEAGLSEYYAGGGTGLESRFLNCIIRALKPGGRAFVILPKSMLARVDEKIKQFVRDEVIIDGLIYLPNQTFYTTPSATYIVAMTKKRNDSQIQEMPIFAYYISQIGETRDTERNPAPNDLVNMVEEFSLFMANKERFEPSTNFCKVLPIEVLDPSSRWDVDYQWTPKELAELEVVDTNIRSVKGIIAELEHVTERVSKAKERLEGLLTKADSYAKLGLDDDKYFKIYRGNRITKSECKENPGDVPVVASGRHEASYLGTISEEYVKRKGLGLFRNRDNILSLGATGAVGSVHHRREAVWFLHDDALAVEVVDSAILPEYFRYELQQVIDRARFDYTAKLYEERLRGLVISIPQCKDGFFDVDLQRTIANAYREKEEIEYVLRDLSKRLQSVSLDFSPAETTVTKKGLRK